MKVFPLLRGAEATSFGRIVVTELTDTIAEFLRSS
jgi:hypothetical protein